MTGLESAFYRVPDAVWESVKVTEEHAEAVAADIVLRALRVVADSEGLVRSGDKRSFARQGDDEAALPQ